MAIGKRRASNFGMLQNYLSGLRAMLAPKPAPHARPVDPIVASRIAGRRGVAATPMGNDRRAENYRRQRGGLAPVLTDRQRRRLRKAGPHLFPDALNGRTR